MIQKRRIW